MKKAAFIIILMFSLVVGESACKGASDHGIITLNTDNFVSETSSGVVMVDFWATWCMPCKAMAPAVEEIAEQMKGKVKVGKVDIDKNGSLANSFGINSIPTLIIFKDGKPVETMVGLKSKEEIINVLSKYIALQ